MLWLSSVRLLRIVSTARKLAVNYFDNEDKSVLNTTMMNLLVDPSAPQEIPCGSTVNIADYEFGYVDLVSPGWPDGYSNNVRCDWTVTAEPGMVVKAEAIEWEVNNNLSETSMNELLWW